jgi:hypothetical protein
VVLPITCPDAVGLAGRESQVDIDRMVAGAEKFKAADEKLKKKAEARNGLEGYCFGLRNSINQEQFAAALKPEDEEKIQKEVNDSIGGDTGTVTRPFRNQTVSQDFRVFSMGSAKHFAFLSLGLCFLLLVLRLGRPFPGSVTLWGIECSIVHEPSG